MDAAQDCFLDSYRALDHRGLFGVTDFRRGSDRTVEEIQDLRGFERIGTSLALNEIEKRARDVFGFNSPAAIEELGDLRESVIEPWYRRALTLRRMSEPDNSGDSRCSSSRNQDACRYDHESKSKAPTEWSGQRISPVESDSELNLAWRPRTCDISKPALGVACRRPEALRIDVQKLRLIERVDQICPELET